MSVEDLDTSRDTRNLVARSYGIKFKTLLGKVWVKVLKLVCLLGYRVRAARLSPHRSLHLATSDTASLSLGCRSISVDLQTMHGRG